MKFMKALLRPSPTLPRCRDDMRHGIDHCDKPRVDMGSQVHILSAQATVRYCLNGNEDELLIPIFQLETSIAPCLQMQRQAKLENS